MDEAAVDRLLREHLESVHSRIHAAAARSGRPASAVRLVAVTKNVPAGITGRLIDLGHRALGENRVQEAEPKIELLGRAAEWHLIGHLQSNKVRRAIALFDWIHSLDSKALVERVDRAAAASGVERRPKVLLQLNVSGEAAKHGALAEDERALLDAGREARALEVVGLMTMAPLDSDPETARPWFRKLRETFERERQGFSASFRELSMGMSGDFEVAVEEGATLVRVGRALFDGVLAAAGSEAPDSSHATRPDRPIRPMREDR